MVIESYVQQQQDKARVRNLPCYDILRLHEVNPTAWLIDVLKRIPTTAKEDHYTLLPHHWKAARVLAKAE